MISGDDIFNTFDILLDSCYYLILGMMILQMVYLQFVSYFSPLHYILCNLIIKNKTQSVKRQGCTLCKILYS